MKFLNSFADNFKNERPKTLEQSELVQACAGTALYLPLPLHCTVNPSLITNQIQGVP